MTCTNINNTLNTHAWSLELVWLETTTGKFLLRNRSISALSGRMQFLSCDIRSVALLKILFDGTEDSGMETYLHATSTKQGHNLANMSKGGFVLNVPYWFFKVHVYHDFSCISALSFMLKTIFTVANISSNRFHNVLDCWSVDCASVIACFGYGSFPPHEKFESHNSHSWISNILALAEQVAEENTFTLNLGSSTAAKT